MNYPEIKFEARPSKVVLGQVGLFALKKFKKDEIIIDKTFWDETKFISWEEYDLLDLKTKESLENFCYKDDKGIYAPQNINKINIAYFFNHSCEPNSYSDEDGNYIASRDIENAEEFTIDVESLMKKTVKEFICNCGSEKCRKIIRI